MGNEKPLISYKGLIAMAIQNSPNEEASLIEINEWIQNAFPYYQNCGNQWKNSIRHNLSLAKEFYNVKGKEKGGGIWRIDSKNSKEIFKYIEKSIKKCNNFVLVNKKKKLDDAIKNIPAVVDESPPEMIFEQQSSPMKKDTVSQNDQKSAIFLHVLELYISRVLNFPGKNK